MQSIFDTIFFPVRVLLMRERGWFGLSSLREERMRFVARFCKGRVLDVGCGPDNLFIENFIGKEKGVGIDTFAYHGVKNIVQDLTKISFPDASFDTVTLIAVGGHIPQSQRKNEFAELARLLKPNGFLIMTEGEPVSQFLIHKWESLRKAGLDYERGMAKGEEYCLPLKEILEYLNTWPLKFEKRIPFMWGLNNVYIAVKENQ